MAIAQDGGGFLAGKLHGILGYGGAQNVVEPGIAFHFFLSGSVRQDDVVVLILAGHGKTFGVEDSNYFTGEVFYADNFSDGIFGAKELLANGEANIANVRGTFDIFVGEDGALIGVPTLDVKEFRGHAAIGGKPVLIAVNDLHVIIDVGRNCLDESDLVFDGSGVGHGEGRRSVRAGAYAIDRAASGFDPHEIVAEIVHLFFDARLAGFADGYDADYGSDADGDAHDSQQAAHFISEQGDERGAKKCGVVHG
jgi:hypothetical protein